MWCSLAWPRQLAGYECFLLGLTVLTNDHAGIPFNNAPCGGEVRSSEKPFEFPHVRVADVEEVLAMIRPEEMEAIASSNKKLVVTSATLVVTGALLVVTRS